MIDRICQRFADWLIDVLFHIDGFDNDGRRRR